LYLLPDNPERAKGYRFYPLRAHFVRKPLGTHCGPYRNHGQKNAKLPLQQFYI
jgi:hypothetical protein